MSGQVSAFSPSGDASLSKPRAIKKHSPDGAAQLPQSSGIPAAATPAAAASGKPSNSPTPERSSSSESGSNCSSSKYQQRLNCSIRSNGTGTLPAAVAAVAAATAAAAASGSTEPLTSTLWLLSLLRRQSTIPVRVDNRAFKGRLLRCCFCSRDRSRSKNTPCTHHCHTIQPPLHRRKASEIPLVPNGETQEQQAKQQQLQLVLLNKGSECKIAKARQQTSNSLQTALNRREAKGVDQTQCCRGK